MPKLFLTNVRREDDATTRALRQVLGPLQERSERLDGLVVFHCALWRAFGTKERPRDEVRERLSGSRWGSMRFCSTLFYVCCDILSTILTYTYTYIYMYQFRSVRGGGPAIWLVTLYNTRNIP